MTTFSKNISLPLRCFSEWRSQISLVQASRAYWVFGVLLDSAGIGIFTIRQAIDAFDSRDHFSLDLQPEPEH